MNSTIKHTVFYSFFQFKKEGVKYNAAESAAGFFTLRLTLTESKHMNEGGFTVNMQHFRFTGFQKFNTFTHILVYRHTNIWYIKQVVSHLMLEICDVVKTLALPLKRVAFYETAGLT